MTEQVEIAVVGAGPGGLEAALAAARAGARVTLIDGYRQAGGQYYRQQPPEFQAKTQSRRQRSGRALWEKTRKAGVRLLSATTVWGAFEGNVLALHGPDAPPYLRAQAIVLATGAYDRPVAFPGWTLPGVMTAGAAQTLLKEQRILPGRQVLLAGTGPLQVVLAAELIRAGAEVVAVLEGAPLLRSGLRHAPGIMGQWGRLGEGLASWLAVARRRVPLRLGWGIVAAYGGDSVAWATIARLDRNWRPVRGTEKTLACDTLCLGYGFIPSNTLSRLLGARQVWRPDLGGEVPVRDARMQTSVAGVYAAGDGAGIGGARLAALEGRVAGLAAAGRLGYRATSVDGAIKKLGPVLAQERRFQRMYAALFTPGPGLYELGEDDTVLCRCEEVTVADVRRTIALGVDTADEAKRISRCGMGNCQGRMCSHLVAHLVARETGRPVADVGQFSPRPPILPVPITALSGEAEP